MQNCEKTLKSDCCLLVPDCIQQNDEARMNSVFYSWQTVETESVV